MNALRARGVVTGGDRDPRRVETSASASAAVAAVDGRSLRLAKRERRRSDLVRRPVV